MELLVVFIGEMVLNIIVKMRGAKGLLLLLVLFLFAFKLVVVANCEGLCQLCRLIGSGLDPSRNPAQRVVQGLHRDPALYKLYVSM